jgi:3-oxoacyl-[acyl-carrier protein] reductase
MNIELTGKTALVGGSSRGIGKACAIELALLGANVIVAARSEEKLLDVVSLLNTDKGQRHEILLLDYDKVESTKTAIEVIAEQKPVHILVNNTGGPKAGPIFSAEPEEFEVAFKRHIIISQIMAQAFVPGMKESGYGRIINIISTSVKEPIMGLGVSNTIRGAMGNWAKTLASELAPSGITVNNILPGFTATERLDEIINFRAEKQNVLSSEVEEQMKSVVPMGRFADPSELSAAVGFLASPAASYITGINLPVDGGRTKSL